MKALDIASIFIDRYGKTLALTNLTLNKLVYFAQVESLRNNPECPQFTDEIQAWEYGPVEPSVYNEFKQFGRNRICNAPNHETNQYADCIVDTVVEKYAWMNSFDLVNYAHRAGGAWHNVYDVSQNKSILVQNILQSSDVTSYPTKKNTFISAVDAVKKQYLNTLRILGDA